MEEASQYCGHSRNPVPLFSRYPHYLCRECLKLLTDKEGRGVVFYNTHIMGYGCQGYYTDSDEKEKYEGTVAFIGDKQYYAKEARFGGIVVQPLIEPQKPPA
jgi:hypothetical protein